MPIPKEIIDNGEGNKLVNFLNNTLNYTVYYVKNKFIKLWLLLQYFVIVGIITSFILSLMFKKNLFKSSYLPTNFQATITPIILFVLSIASIIGIKKKAVSGFYFNCSFIILVLIILIQQLVFSINFVDALVALFYLIFLIQLYKEKKYFMTKNEL